MRSFLKAQITITNQNHRKRAGNGKPGRGNGLLAYESAWREIRMNPEQNNLRADPGTSWYLTE